VSASGGLKLQCVTIIVTYSSCVYDVYIRCAETTDALMQCLNVLTVTAVSVLVAALFNVAGSNQGSYDITTPCAENSTYCVSCIDYFIKLIFFGNTEKNIGLNVYDLTVLCKR